MHKCSMAAQYNHIELVQKGSLAVNLCSRFDRTSRNGTEALLLHQAYAFIESFLGIKCLLIYNARNCD